MATAPLQPGQIKTGPGVIRWAPLGTPFPTVSVVNSKLVMTWGALWLPVGGTDAGLTYSESTDTEEIRVAESPYPIRVEITGKAGSVNFEMNQISDVNWKLAMNGGTITVTGSAGTKLSEYIPPLMGQETNVMLGFQSRDDEEGLLWPQVFNTGSVETARADTATKAGLPAEFAVQLPDPAVLTTPYKRWTAGSLAQYAPAA
ncbi:hypothetical protein [Winogradskya humida]|uniref:Major tail protein n=1 Tax=Winogradskya humida TaxID=113566 RepID=A0ABQ4A7K9_9ACTN|nr:hypothetical protein [Actinoplanes humidus]GIE26694.1 hypothetical protein Ahu01nite_097960 [Actinoplanes humidus]